MPRASSRLRPCAVALAVVLVTGCAASTRARIDAWSTRVQVYQLGVQSWQSDADNLLADYTLLQRHPAFSNADRKFQETRARVLVEGPDQEVPLITEMVQSMSLDEKLVLRTTLRLSERYSELKLRGEALDTERVMLLAER